MNSRTRNFKPQTLGGENVNGSENHLHMLQLQANFQRLSKPDLRDKQRHFAFRFVKMIFRTLYAFF